MAQLDREELTAESSAATDAIAAEVAVPRGLAPPTMASVGRHANVTSAMVLKPIGRRARRAVTAAMLCAIFVVGCSSLGRLAAGDGGPASPGSTALASPDASVAAYIRSMLDVQLESLPPDAAPAKIGQEQAVAIASAAFGQSNSPVDVEHGLGVVSAQESATVWMVVFATPDASPIAVGPMCESAQGAPTDCGLHAVVDLRGAFVSDQTGEIVMSFDRGSLVPSPTP